MNPNHKFFIAHTSDKVIWGIARSPLAAQADCERWLGNWKRHYTNNYRGAKVAIVPATKKLYDLICQYGSYDKQWKMVDGVAELAK